AGVGVLLINLNGTKFLNESFGHKIGDDLLKAVAAKLTSLKRSTDVIGRLGGDEFAVIMTNFLLPGHALTQARKILDGISVPMATRDGEHPVTAAAGLVAETISRKSSTTPDLVDRMMQLAGRAMFEAKQRTRMRGMSELVMGRLGQDSVH
ncbi:MAG: GGDEF domain-containing protein, partial [Rhodospirillaceae bacterium]|nr:GGDEF domain-containing protein [Rhodospirillaceae bacterium]